MKLLKFAFLFILCLPALFQNDLQQTDYVNLSFLEEYNTGSMISDNCSIDFSEAHVRLVQQQKRNRTFSSHPTFLKEDFTFKVHIPQDYLFKELAVQHPISSETHILFCVYRL